MASGHGSSPRSSDSERSADRFSEAQGGVISHVSDVFLPLTRSETLFTVLRSLQLGYEYVLAGQPLLRQSLLKVVPQECVDRLAVGFETIRPPVIAEQTDIFIDQLAEPRNHGSPCC